MDSLNNIIKGFKLPPETAKAHNEVLNDILHDKICKSFIEQNDLSSKFIENHLIEFLEMKEYNASCVGCKGIGSCNKKPIGFIKVIDLENNVLFREIFKHFIKKIFRN